MKRFLPMLVCGFLLTGTAFSQEKLIISELADPADDYTGRFIEFFNLGDATIDFSTSVYYLSRQSNGSTWADVQLAGTIEAGATFTVANLTDFSALYGSDPDFNWSGINGNGDDAYYLFKNGDHTSGTLVDIYGAKDKDGTGEPWEYTDSRVVRNPYMTGPNTTWTASEWTIIPSSDVADFNPGVHSNVDDQAPVWAPEYPAAINILEASFDIAIKLNETGTVYYVVMEGGAAEPSVAEVMAGTGSAGSDPVTAGSLAGSTDESLETIGSLTTDLEYDIYLVAGDDESTPNVQDAVTKISATPTTPYDKLVTANFDGVLDPFKAVSVTGEEAWNDTTGGGLTYARMSGYNGTAQENEDWLISPAINLDNSTLNSFEFVSAANFNGPAIQLMISSDFTGTYDSTNVVDATWSDITADAAISSGSWEWTNSGVLDLSAYSGKVYLAFRYSSNPTDGAATWEITDALVTGFLRTDASLSDLTVDGVTIDGFDPEVLTYTVDLPAGTTDVPSVGYTLNDPYASAIQANAADLRGNKASRTTKILVSTGGGTTTQMYTVTFNPVVEVADIAGLRAKFDPTRKFRITGEVIVTHHDGYRNKKYVEDGSAAIEIDDAPGVITSNYNVGDGITGLTGTLEDYFGYLELHPLEDPGAATSTGNTIEPQVVSIYEFNQHFSDYASEFVKVEGVGFAQAGGSFANGVNYKMGIPGDSTYLRVHFYSTTLTGMSIPAKADVQGIALWDYNIAKIAPRNGDDLFPVSSVATLSDLLVNSVSLEGFDPAEISYNMELPFGTTGIPALEGVPGDESASIQYAMPVNLTGTVEERTATITVTSADEMNVTTYTIVFSVNTGIELHDGTGVKLYPVPAASKLYIAGLQGNHDIRIINLLGSVVKTATVNGANAEIDISDLRAGVYVLRTGELTLRFVKK